MKRIDFNFPRKRGVRFAWRVLCLVIGWFGMLDTRSAYLGGPDSPGAYRRAKEIAEILRSGCDVAEGIVSRVDLPPAGPDVSPSDAPASRIVTLKEVRWLSGDRGSADGTLTTTSYAPPKRSKSADGPWQAWAGVELKIGDRLGILFWKDGSGPRWSGRRVEVAGVASGDPDLAMLRRLVSLSSEDRSTAGAGDGVWNRPADGWSMAELGYLVAVGLDRIASVNGDHSVDLALAVWSDATRGEFVYEDLGAWIAANAYRLSPDSVSRLTRALLVQATGPENTRSRVALRTLARMVEAGTTDLTGRLDPDSARVLGTRTRAWLAETEYEGMRTRILEQIRSPR